MQLFNLINMGFILSGLAFTACENGPEDQYKTQGKVHAETKLSNAYVQLFSASVNGRDWKKISGTDRFVEIALPSITETVMKEGIVAIYLYESGKTIALPFTYYQVRRALSFQPSYELGRVYVNILGHFIFNVHTSYTFRVLVVQPEGLNKFKNVNWHNYNEVKYVLNATD